MLCKKRFSFLTEERASGTLFKVDFRLRPYAEGALAVPAKRYAEYYGKEAQGWEVQSLCRARFVGGAKKVGGGVLACGGESLVEKGEKRRILFLK